MEADLNVWLNMYRDGETVAIPNDTPDARGTAKLSKSDSYNPLLGAVIAGLRALLDAWDVDRVPCKYIRMPIRDGCLTISNAQKWVIGLSFELGYRLAAFIGQARPEHNAETFETWAKQIIKAGDAVLVLDHVRD